MLEIIIVWNLAKHMGQIVEPKGYKKSTYQAAVVILWFVSEFIGGVLGGVVAVMQGNSDPGLLPYGIALALATLSASILFVIAKRLPTKTPTPASVRPYYPPIADPNTPPQNLSSSSSPFDQR